MDQNNIQRFAGVAGNANKLDSELSISVRLEMDEFRGCKNDLDAIERHNLSALDLIPGEDKIARAKF